MNIKLTIRGMTMLVACIAASLQNSIQAQNHQIAADFNTGTAWSSTRAGVDSTAKRQVPGKSAITGEMKSRPSIQNLKPKKKQSRVNRNGSPLSEAWQNQNSAVTACPSPDAKKIILESDAFLRQDNIIRLSDNSGKNINLHPSCFSYDDRQLTIDLSEVNKGNYVLLILKKDGKIVCSTNIVKS